MNYQIWLALCSFFLIFNFKLLIDDYDLINYMIVDKNNDLYSISNRFLFCIRFEDIKEKDKLIIEKEIDMNVPASEFLNYTIKSIELYLNTSNLFKLNQSFILSNAVCFLVNKEELETVRPLNGLIKYYRFNFLYADPNIVHPIRSDYIYQGHADSHFYNLKIKREKIYNLNYLKNSNCLNEKLLNLINCINKCLDLVYTDYYYGFYNYSDDRKFNLESISNNVKRIIKKDTNITKLFFRQKYVDNNKYEELTSCFNSCPNNNCNYEIYNAIRIGYNPLKTFKDKIIDIESSIYLAYYLINDFWLQLIGLICLITGASLINLLLSFQNFVFSENRRKNFQFLIHYHQKYFKFIRLKFIFLFLFLLIILIQSLIMFKEYDFKSRYPNITSYINYSTNLPSLILCFPVQLLMFNNYNFKLDDILLNYTYNELENKSNFNGSKLIDKIEFVYGNRKRFLGLNNKIKWKINDNGIYFKGSRLVNYNHDYLSRCFRIELEYSSKLKYEYLNPIHYLEIKFKTKFWNLFLIDKNQNLTIDTTEIKEGNSFRKIEISKLVKCNNLKNDKMIRINRCINKRFIEQFNSLPLYSLINKNELIQLNLSINNLKFNTNKSNYNQIETDCQAKFNNFTDCNQIKYEETFKETQKFTFNSIRINLNYESYYEYEFEQSLTKLSLNIVNLVSISLGVTVIGLLSSLSRIIKFEFAKMIVIIICLIGFLIHNFFIFKGIVDEKLSHSLYFEKLDYYKLPNILICFDLDKEIKIDDNYKLTSNYLNRKTNQFNLEKIFDQIFYFNKTNYNLFKPYDNNSNNNEISIRTLYFLNFKCFEFELKIEFTDNDLYVYPYKPFLFIYFNQTFIDNFKLIYFLYRYSNSNQFSDLLKCEFEFNKNLSFKYTSYGIVFELMEIDKEDNFELLKSPLSLLYGSVNLDDTTSYLNNLRNKYKELTNLTTREIMLENDNFNLEIDEDLFKQYYLQLQNYSDYNYPNSFNLIQYYYDFQSERRNFLKPRLNFRILSKKRK